MNRLFLLVVATMMTIQANSQTYFQKGMRWTTQISSTSTPEATLTIETDTIEKDTVADGFQAMVLRRSYDRLMEDERLLIRTDGDKVLFKMLDAKDGEWYLLYDFGLREGDGCYVYAPYGEGQLNKMFVKCVETNASDAAYGGLSTLLVEEYEEETSQVSYGKGIWLKGLSAAQGLLYCNGFDLDGRGTILLEAAADGQVLYKRNATSVQQIIDQSSVRTQGLQVYVSKLQTGSQVFLYSTDGRLLGRTFASGNEAHLTLPKAGVYLLKAGGQTTKLLAR